MPAMHIGTDHLWGYVPMLVVAALVVFLGAVALRTKLERWASRDDDSEEPRG